MTMAGQWLATVLHHARSVASLVGHCGRWMGLDRLRQQSRDTMDGLDAGEMDGYHRARHIKKNRGADVVKAKLRNCGNKSPGIPIVRHPGAA